MNSPLSCVILASGGKHRLGNERPKVMYPLLGEPLLGYALRTVESLGIKHITVVAPEWGGDSIQRYVGSRAVVVHQVGEGGSGKGLLCAKDRISGFPGDVITVYGDRPLLRHATLATLVRECAKQGAACGVSSVYMRKPEGYGRIVKNEGGSVVRISRDCGLFLVEDLSIQEVIAGCYFFEKKALLAALETNEPDMGDEFYVMDIVGRIAQNNKVISFEVQEPIEARGVNSLEDLVSAEKWMRAHSSAAVEVGSSS